MGERSFRSRYSRGGTGVMHPPGLNPQEGAKSSVTPMDNTKNTPATGTIARSVATSPDAPMPEDESTEAIKCVEEKKRPPGDRHLQELTATCD